MESQGKHSETICLELTVSKKKWCITFAYRPPSNDNKAIFFNEPTTSLSQITNLCDYFVVMGDLDIDTSDKPKIHHVTYSSTIWGCLLHSKSHLKSEMKF